MRNIIFAGVLMFVALNLTGCGKVDRDIARLTGNPVKVCYQGVQYVQLTSGASVAYNTDGSIKLCEE
jgi:hypothetical protein